MDSLIALAVLVVLEAATAVLTAVAKKRPTRQKLLTAAIGWLSMLAFAAVWAVIAFFA
ncbi:MAG: hypothetical protein IKM04_05295 [Clostridia bacterium]|nr:hypothetical protein [Clostridia bacterium]